MDELDELDELEKLIDSKFEEVISNRNSSSKEKLTASGGKEKEKEKSKSKSMFELKSSSVTLDKDYNLVDGEGNVVDVEGVGERSEFLVNRNRDGRKSKRKQMRKIDTFLKYGRNDKSVERRSGSFFDPALGKINVRKRRRGGGGLKFIKPGKFVDQARKKRKMSVIDSHYQLVMKNLNRGKEGGDGKIELGEGQLIIGLEDVPELEPWDKKLFEGVDEAKFENDVQAQTKIKFFKNAGDYETMLREDKDELLFPVPFSFLNESLVTHPIETKGLIEEKISGPQELILTKKEKRKLRKQARLQKEFEKQEKIRVGLVDPPAPKANLKNFMKVYLNDASQDPTKLERQIRKEIAQRKDEHTQRNQERKLSKEEKRAKKVKKELEDEEEEIKCYLYKVGSVKHPYHRFKINSLAYKFVLSGCCFELRTKEDSFAECIFVLVEGGKKNVKRFNNKIEKVRWNLDNNNNPIDFSLKENRGLSKNYCKLVWQGTHLSKAFRHFSFKKFSTYKEGYEFLTEMNIRNYFDLVNHKIL